MHGRTTAACAAINIDQLPLGTDAEVYDYVEEAEVERDEEGMGLRGGAWRHSQEEGAGKDVYNSL